jgi:crossover junction endodeoxyribonuclease RuvC
MKRVGVATVKPHRSLASSLPRVVLGIDPGLATTGWGVIEKDLGKMTLRAFGTIQTLANDDLSTRLLQIQKALSDLIDAHAPDVLAIEELFFTKFAVSIASTAQARGAILLTAALKAVPLVEYNPRAVKMAMTGFGSASKFQMQSMLQRFFQLKELPTPDDAADAVAIALCHTQTQTSLKVTTTRKTRALFETELLQRSLP